MMSESTKVVTDQKEIKKDVLKEIYNEIVVRLIQIDDIEIMGMVETKLCGIRNELREITNEFENIHVKHLKNAEDEHKEAMKRIKKEKGLKP